MLLSLFSLCCKLATRVLCSVTDNFLGFKLLGKCFDELGDYELLHNHFSQSFRKIFWGKYFFDVIFLTVLQSCYCHLFYNLVSLGRKKKIMYSFLYFLFPVYRITYSGIPYIDIQSSNLCLSVCLFVCSIITLELLDRFVTNFDCGTWENHGNVLRFKVEWVDFYREKQV